MKHFEHRIIFDVDQSSPQTNIVMRQGDTAQRLVFEFRQSGKPYIIDEGVNAVLSGVMASGATIYGSCEIDGNCAIYDVRRTLTVDDDTEITAPLTSEIGVHQCQVRIYSPSDTESSYRNTTNAFTVTVMPMLNAGNTESQTVIDWSAVESLAANAMQQQEINLACNALVAIPGTGDGGQYWSTPDPSKCNDALNSMDFSEFRDAAWIYDEFMDYDDGNGVYSVTESKSAGDKGDKGDKGDRGLRGENGTQINTGNLINNTVVGETENVLGVLLIPRLNDLYISTNTGCLHKCVNVVGAAASGDWQCIINLSEL